MKCAGYSSLVWFIYSIFGHLKKLQHLIRRTQSDDQFEVNFWLNDEKIIQTDEKWSFSWKNGNTTLWICWHHFDTLLPRYLQRKILLKCHILEDFFFLSWWIARIEGTNVCVGFGKKNHCKKRLLLMIWSSTSNQFYMQLV